jgi:hypothetical protein
LSAPIISTNIFIALTYTTIIITLEPCALNAFNISCLDLIKFPHFMDTFKEGLKEGFEGEKSPKDKVTL